MKNYDLGINDLAKMYNRTRVTIYNWINAGLPRKKVMDGLREVYRFNKEEVEEWIQSQKS